MNDSLRPDATLAEARRQQAMLAALWSRPADASAGFAEQGHRLQQGLAAYTGNARALAARALAATYPTVEAMLGSEDFTHLARELWLAHPPSRGDLAEWGEQLPTYLAAHPQLQAWPWLPDSARLDWAVHVCERAADPRFDPSSLQLLQDAEPDHLTLALAPGLCVLVSAYPIALLHAAHHPASATLAPGAESPAPSLDTARQALESGEAENVLVARKGWHAGVYTLTRGEATFVQHLLAGSSLGSALSAAWGQQSPAAFDFGTWLARALQAGWMQGVQPLPETPAVQPVRAPI